ncbi:MAG: nicotinate (nicotinamide) nucleotide adenylyltransferase [Clostridia bacterium]|nr:nicotinate (nicotinamide) nucleotide adenylyltransferase [Clostridia bacterium]
MKIGILGGTFDPPHNGHLHLANCIADELNLDKIIIIPAFAAPHKTDKKTSSAEDRFNMCKLCFNSDFFEVSDIEINRGGKSYTIDTLTALKEKYPDDDFYLIIGSDMLEYFSKWYRYEDILRLCTLCCVGRENKALSLPDFFTDKNQVYLSSAKPLEMSSTFIRNAVKNCTDIKGCLPENVAHYINERKLYLD